jgi:hypothetical protein
LRLLSFEWWLGGTVLYPFLGPVLLASGMAFVHLSIRGLPMRATSAVQKKGPAPGFGREDQLMGEVLSELLDLREQLAGLKDDAGRLARKRRSKSPKSV